MEHDTQSIQGWTNIIIYTFLYGQNIQDNKEDKKGWHVQLRGG